MIDKYLDRTFLLVIPTCCKICELTFEESLDAILQGPTIARDDVCIAKEVFQKRLESDDVRREISKKKIKNSVVRFQ